MCGDFVPVCLEATAVGIGRSGICIVFLIFSDPASPRRLPGFVRRDLEPFRYGSGFGTVGLVAPRLWTGSFDDRSVLGLGDAFRARGHGHFSSLRKKGQRRDFRAAALDFAGDDYVNVIDVSDFYPDRGLLSEKTIFGR